MPSFVPDFEYDIFISYRHNDNRPSAGSGGWVAEFVNALQEELAATIKEPLSIYFDKNPHDGLLETHHVDKSLEGKLKCLIFIPIISQTYCDPKSFAWQHEFCAFNRLAQEDQLGRDIKLSNGNVASRILPIKIHDLDTEDKATIENEIGGVLRAIEFIYNEAGVNRPLNANDNKNDNQNKTDYRNQINKAANAIKEIVSALKPTKTFTDKFENTIIHPTKSTRKLGALIAAVIFILSIVAFFLYPSVMAPTVIEELEKSIAVLPFVNMSGDPEQEYFSDGISEEIINRLAQIKDLKVIGRSSSFQFKGKNPDIREVGELLDVSTVLEGSIRKSGNQLRITAQLIRVADGSHIWSKNFNREMADIFQIQDEISMAIADQMKLSLGITNRDQVDPELYDLYLKGRALLINRNEGVELSVQIFEKIIQRDSLFQPAWRGLAQAWEVMPLYVSKNDSRNQNFKFAWPKALHAAEQALKLDPDDAETLSAIASVYRSKRNFSEAFEYYKKALAIDTKSAVILEDYAQFLIQVGYSQEALRYAQKVIELDPLSANYYLVYADALLQNGRMVESIEALKAGLKIDPTWEILKLDLIFTYLNMNQIDSALYIMESLRRTQEYDDFKRQLEAVKQNDQTFKFNGNKNPSSNTVEQSLNSFFAMNELNQLDAFFEKMFTASKDPYSPINLHSPMTPQGLTYHAERFLSDPRMKEVLNDYGLVEFWQEHGWPDRCRPIGNGDFICE